MSERGAEEHAEPTAPAANGATRRPTLRPDERRDQMLAVINERAFVRVDELSSQFGSLPPSRYTCGRAEARI